MDVERQMEEQLVQQHMELERVVAIRPEPLTEGGVGYLCKWRGLPYAEATWENTQMIQSIDNGHAMTEAYQACPHLETWGGGGCKKKHRLSSPLTAAMP